jgi:hypothetical protein
MTLYLNRQPHELRSGKPSHVSLGEMDATKIFRQLNTLPVI